MDGTQRSFYRRACGLLVAVGIFSVCNVRAQGLPTGTAHSVTLTWQAPSPVGGSGTVGGYNIYRAPANTAVSTGGGVPTVSYAKVNTTLTAGLTYTDTTVAAGSVYTYCVTTVDSLGEESACSAASTANVPTNPNAPSAPLITTK
jgi:hypothetical protein